MYKVGQNFLIKERPMSSYELLKAVDVSLCVCMLLILKVGTTSVKSIIILNYIEMEV